MSAMRLAELLPDVPGIPAGLHIGGLVQDTRELRTGDAFVAVEGEGGGAHGLNFAAQARVAGAVAVLFEPPAPEGLDVPSDAIAVPRLRAHMGAMAHRFHGSVTDTMDVVGVTGTNGKTSTVQLLVQAWAMQGRTAGSIGTLGAGLHGHLVATGFTTPLVLRLHALLAQMHRDGAQAIAMEVSSHALDQGRVDGVRFDVAVFTNLTRDHLDYHGDMDTYARTKARLFAWPGLRAAAINLDDAFGRELHASLPAGVRGVGLSSRGRDGAAVRAEAITLDNRGITFDLHIGEATHPLRSPLLGRFNVDNLLAVAGVLHALDWAPATIADTLGRLQPVAGRMNRLGGDVDTAGRHRPLVVVDYAHTPDALEQALNSLRAHAQARLVCVFGCGGERDRGKRPQMAAIAESQADTVIVTDDNPRNEDGDTIVAEILEGFRNPERALVQRDRAAAIALAIAEAGPDDIVLIAGKGHEPYQEIGGVQHPFDDTDVARRQLGARP